MRQILKLHGVDCVWIDGRTPYEKRAETVTKFKTDPDCRVLLFSKVGTVGLNLSRANVVIFLVSRQYDIPEFVFAHSL